MLPLARVRELRPVPRLRGPWRPLPRPGGGSCEAPEDETSSTTCSCWSRSAWSRSGSSWSTAPSSGRAAVAAGDPAYYLKRQAIYAALGPRGARRPVARSTSARCATRAGRCSSRASACSSPCSSSERRERRPPLALARRRSTSSPRSSRSSPSCCGSPGYSRAGRKPPAVARASSLKPSGSPCSRICALVLAEPDLGTAIAIVLTVAAMLVVAGTPMRVLGSAAGIVVALALAAIWLEPYRRERLLAFLDPWADPEGCRLPDRPGADRARARAASSASAWARASRRSTSSRNRRPT